MNLATLQKNLGYQFNDTTILQTAITHRSHSSPHYERAEFIGDAVLGLVISAYLIEQFPTIDEGILSRTRSDLVREESLYSIAKSLALSDVIRLGEGERKSGGDKKPSILADGVEAIVGAVFLDGGFAAAQSVVLHLFSPQLRDFNPQALVKDAKTTLQELMQQQKRALPVYTLVGIQGEAHAQTFEICCALLHSKIAANGQGLSRKAAEQAAAKLVLAQLGL